MAYNIGPKIGIDGWAEFRKQITAINTSYRTMEAELKAVSAAYEANGDEAGKLSASTNILEREIAAQKEKLELVQDALKKTTEKYNENSVEASRLRGVMYDTQATLSGLEKKLRDTKSSLENFTGEVENAVDPEDAFQKEISEINAACKAMESKLRAVSAAYELNDDKAEKLTNTSEILGQEIELQKKKLSLLEDAVKKATEAYGENSVEVSKLKTAMYDAQTTVSNLEKKLRDTESELGDSEEAVEDLGEELEDAGKSALDFGDILKGSFAADLLSSAVDKGVDLLKEFAEGSIDAAADVKAANAQFEQTFRGMEKQAAGTLDAVADQTGIAATRMRKSYTSLYAFSKSVGADSGKALNIAQRAMLAAADSAAYYDRSIEETTETLQSFLKGNYENDAALGIAATETTRNAKANELYAKSFKDLSEAQKVDVLLAMVEAGNEASGALGNAAREADEWTNVTGEAAEALHQLQAAAGEPLLEAMTPIVQKLTEYMRELAEVTPGEELRRQIEDFADSWMEAESAFQETMAKTDATAAVAERYIQRLQELETQGLNTAAAHEEYKTVVGQLQTLMPELNLSIDEQTGLLQQNTNALLADVEAWKKSATVQATYDRNRELLKAYGEANASLAESQRRRETMQTEWDTLEEQVRQALSMEGKLDISTKHVSNSIVKLFEVTDQATGKTERFMEKGLGVGAALSDEVEQLWNLQTQMAELDQEIADGTEVVNGYSGQIDEATKQLAALEEQVKDSGQTQKEGNKQVSEGTEELTAQIQELEKAYDDAKTAARESIDQQIGLFDELASKSDWSAEKIIQNWASQREAFARYEENLKKAVDLGLDKTLVTQLSDGSEESMLILDALVNDVEIGVDEINAAFADTSKSRNSVSGMIAGIYTDFDNMYANLEAKARAGGSNTMDGLILGIRSKFQDLKATINDVIDKISGGYNKGLDQHSPSRVMEKSGENTLDGAIIGVDNRIAAFQRKMEEAASAGNDAFLRKRLEEVESYPTYGAGSVVNQTSTSTVRHEYGGVSIQIMQAAGQSAKDMADAVADRLMRQVIDEGGGLGG